MIVHALAAAGAKVSFAEIESDRGHDAFLLDEPEMHAILSGFIDAARARPRSREVTSMLDPTTLSKTPTVPASRVDLAVVGDLVPEGARLLDVGCGDGTLLEWLEAAKHIDGRGIELSQKGRQRRRRARPVGDPG